MLRYPLWKFNLALIYFPHHFCLELIQIHFNVMKKNHTPY